MEDPLLKPIIGVTASAKEGRLSISEDIMFSVIQEGGLPVVLPYLVEEATVAELLTRIDGLLISGGVDVDPLLYGEEPLPQLGSVMPERDSTEIAIIRQALAMDMPVFAICRGAQIVNVAAGGSLYQDVNSQHKGALLHSQRSPRDHVSHYVTVETDSMLYSIAGSDRFLVNSFHHQAVKRLASGFRLTATASDGIIEAYESDRHRFVLGVQWHPENLTRKDAIAQRLFNSFVVACRK
jgi:putative glutamine amidotransferase